MDLQREAEFPCLQQQFLIALPVAAILIFLWLMVSNGMRGPVVDVCIDDATVLLPNGDTVAHRDILIRGNKIFRVVAGHAPSRPKTTISASGKLVTPGWVAIDEHLDDVFGDSLGRLTMHPDSFPQYRKLLTETYLPWGVTTVRTAGDAEEWLDFALYCMRNRRPDAPDFYTSGASWNSPYDGRRYVNHAFVADSLSAVKKVREYSAKGIRHLKLYGNLQYAAFGPAIREAQWLGLSVSSQVQNATGYDSTLALGLRNFEQVATLFYEQTVLDFWNDPIFNRGVDKIWADEEGNRAVGGSRIYPYLEAACFVGKDNPKVDRLLKKMRDAGAGMVPCLHFFAQWLGNTWFCSTPKAPRFDVSGWTQEQMQRCRDGFAVMMHTTFKMWQMGIPLRIGTDHKDGGKAVLSEMLLLHAAGIPMREVILIATRNGAEAIQLGSEIGSVEAGKRANLIIFEADPLRDAQNLLGAKTIVKDGVVYR